MKAAVFDPYLDTIGGGEVYVSSFIELLLKKGYLTDIFWHSNGIRERIHRYLGINVAKAKVNEQGYHLFNKPGNYLKKRKLTAEYDIFFFLSDGSIPWLFAKQNLIHFQIPFTRVGGASVKNQVKLRNIQHLVCNSEFTKKFIDKEFRVKSNVIYPPVNIQTKNVRKENVILSVGRFTKSLHEKRQDLIIDSFKKLTDRGLRGWKLVLIGSDTEGGDYISCLRKSAEGYPINLLVNLDHKKLEHEFAKAKIFWHAAGYGIDEERNPELVEHFGIATVEAMTNGCIVFVINKGGQKEIVKDNKNGYLWNSVNELLDKTLASINNEKKDFKLAINARKQGKKFEKGYFFRNFTTLLNL